MSTLIGRAHQTGILVGATTFAPGDGVTMSGTLSYEHQSLRFAHQGEITEIKNEDGDVCALVATNETLECTFNFIPYGTSVANAIASIQSPRLLTGFDITGFPVFRMGTFADALNTDSGSTQPWIFVGGWEGNGDNSGEPWSISVTLRRFPQITNATALT